MDTGTELPFAAPSSASAEAVAAVGLSGWLHRKPPWTLDTDMVIAPPPYGRYPRRAGELHGESPCPLPAYKRSPHHSDHERFI